MSVLFVLLGESFRWGSQYSRITGLEESVEEQIKASYSHIKLIQHLEQKLNYKVDVCIGTYPTKFNEKLFEVYEKYLKYKIEYKNKIGITKLFQLVLTHYNYRTYDFVFFLRIDLCLKDKIFECNLLDNNKILFPFICFTINNNDKIEGYPRVCDTFISIPKKWFHIIMNIEFYHSSWKLLMENQHLTMKNIDTVIKTYHDSDSEKDLNPLYYITNRPQCQTSYNNEKQIFNKYNYKIIKILVVGPKQCGSTLLFNLLIKLYEQSGKNVKSGWELNILKLTKMDKTIQVIIDKRHDCKIEILQYYDFVFLPMRHIIDSAISSNKRFNTPYIESCYENIQLVDKFINYSDFVFKYEKYSLQLVNKIIKFLTLNIDINTVITIMIELENMKNSKDIVEKDNHKNKLYRKTLLSKSHNTSGGVINKYIYTLDQSECIKLLNEKTIFNFLVKYKYV
jgi:hypothetical protein